MIVEAIVDDRTLRELYGAGFETAVRRAQPWTVMTAYNRVNGSYCSEDRWLLTELLREDWGFEGFWHKFQQLDSPGGRVKLLSSTFDIDTRDKFFYNLSPCRGGPEATAGD